MRFQQFYLGCLAHASYFIESHGEAAVVDPQRDVEQYIEAANAAGATIRYVIETHLHADFVSGHRELAERTGARIVFGSRAGASIPHLAAADREELSIGNVTLRIFETPGHTPESISILVTNRAISSDSPKLLTGDTLFIGDVGRPDLAGGAGFSQEEMASMLYDSLQRLMTLDDSVEVYPAHGAGSMCGKNISKARSSTIGEQRKTNYALQPMSRDEFIRLVTSDLPPIPKYFMRDASINRSGAAALADLPKPALLSPADVDARQKSGSVVLDVRDSEAFGEGHVPAAVNIGLQGQFASWAGTLLSLDDSVVIVADSKRAVEEAAMRLARVGIENIDGYLDGGMEAWRREGLPVEKIEQIDVALLRKELESNSRLQLVDVRRPPEFTSGHIAGSIPAELLTIEQQLARLDIARPTAVICAGGYRSSMASSILQRHGFRELQNVVGGTAAWIAAGYPVERV